MKALIQKVSVTLIASAIAFSAWSIELGDAKSQGLVGEKADGYLGAVQTSAEVDKLVASVNKKRKEIYMNLARKNSLTMQQVTALAAKKAIEKTEKGHLIQNAAGDWVKK